MAHYTTVTLPTLLEIEKIEGLRQTKGNFSSEISLPVNSKEELLWWIANLLFSCKAISHGEADIVIQTDASSQGWGGMHGDQRAGGRWTPTEALNHINYLELLAIFSSLKALCGMSFVRKLFEDRGFSKKTTDIIMLQAISNIGENVSSDIRTP